MSHLSDDILIMSLLFSSFSGGRGGSAPSRGTRPQKTPATAEDLDKEMENYHTAAAPPSAAAAGQPVSV